MSMNYLSNPYSLYDLEFIKSELRYNGSMSPKDYGQRLLFSKRKRK